MFPEKVNVHSLLEMTVHGYKIQDNSSAVYGLPAHTISKSEYVYPLFFCLLSFDNSNKDTDMRKRQRKTQGYNTHCRLTETFGQVFLERLKS